MLQLAAALSSLTLVAVTGTRGILGLGPAIFLASGAAAVGPAGRLSDRFGRMPVIRAGFAAGALGCAVVAAGCAASSAVLVCLGLAFPRLRVETGPRVPLQSRPGGRLSATFL